MCIVSSDYKMNSDSNAYLDSPSGEKFIQVGIQPCSHEL